MTIALVLGALVVGVAGGYFLGHKFPMINWIPKKYYKKIVDDILNVD